MVITNNGELKLQFSLVMFHHPVDSRFTVHVLFSTYVIYSCSLFCLEENDVTPFSFG